MTELVQRALDCAKVDDFDGVLSYAKSMSPPEYKVFFESVGEFKGNPDFLDKMGNALSYKDMSAFLDLGSSKRMAQYLTDKAKNKELTDEEIAELKGAVL